MRHAAVVTKASSTGDEDTATIGAPRADNTWDTSRVWKLVGGDVELYTLALARALLLGVPVDLPTLRWNAESIIGDLWTGMTKDLRDLVSLLAVHGRPLPAAALPTLGLGTKATVNVGFSANLLEKSRGMLSLTSSATWLKLLTQTARRARHQQLANAFARVAREAVDLEAAPLAVLEAHRHYAAVPAIKQATEFARFGVAMLLGTAKQMSFDAREEAHLYGKSSHIYELVLKLDQQVREQGDPEGSGSRARAYAVHYLAYNRYKANLDEPSETLSAYREALAIWPKNALFWSRTISCCFVANRYAEGLRARDDAFLAVPLHPQRASFLIFRTVEHLLARDLVLAAILVRSNERLSNIQDKEVENELLARLDSGWEDDRLLARGVLPLHFQWPVPVRITCVERVYTCHLAGKMSSGNSAETALAAAIHELHEEARDLLEDPAPSPDRLQRRDSLLQMLDFEAMRSNGEESRWEAYLASLNALVTSGTMTTDQSRGLLLLWRRARARFARLRRPAAGRSDDGRLSLSWSFVDIKGVTFTIDIERDGRVDWFYRNAPLGKVRGTEDEPDAELPEEALLLLEAFGS
jgi:tetratricopeptide (TPR) repeat protein